MKSHTWWTLTIALLSGCVASSSLDVTLTSGNFRGIPTENGTEKWLGIPYATPPTGKLRFKAPTAFIKSNNSLQQASTFGNACPQPPANLGAAMSEDCLFLNVHYSLLSKVMCFLDSTPTGLASSKYKFRCKTPGAGLDTRMITTAYFIFPILTLFVFP